MSPYTPRRPHHGACERRQRGFADLSKGDHPQDPDPAEPRPGWVRRRLGHRPCFDHQRRPLAVQIERETDHGQALALLLDGSNQATTRLTLSTAGAMTAGRMQGAQLSKLSTAELQGLVAEFEAAGDEESLALLLAYLDRRSTARAASPPPGQPRDKLSRGRILAPTTGMWAPPVGFCGSLKSDHPQDPDPAEPDYPDLPVEFA